MAAALKATVLAPVGRRPGWGTIPRGEEILEQPTEVVAPLPDDPLFIRTG